MGVLPEPDTHPPVATPPPVRPLERPHPLTPFVRSWIWLVGLGLLLGRDYVERMVQGQPIRAPGSVWFLASAVIGVLAIMVAVGYLTWRTTAFVIDDDEVRVEHRLIFHRSDRIAFHRIQSVDLVQPFAARLLGLAALRIDVGAGRPKEISFLSRSRAAQMRDFLLARAHSDQARLDDQRGTASAVDDLAPTDRVIVRVRPLHLMVMTVTSYEFLALALGAVGAAVVPFLLTDEVAATIGALPLLLSAAGILSRSVVRQWRFTLADTGNGVRLSRGMTSLESQSVPVDRIQGVRIDQSLVNRPMGLYHVRMEVLGVFGEGESQSNDVLLPAGTWTDVKAALNAIWPGFELDQVALHPVPRRARWLHWFTAQTIRWGYNDGVIVARSGLLITSTTVVPHARAQSVALTQGPLQRRLRLANVSVHTSTGPVHLECRVMDQSDARELAMSELDRAARARAIERPRAAVPEPTYPAPTFPGPTDPAPTNPEPTIPAAGTPHAVPSSPVAPHAVPSSPAAPHAVPSSPVAPHLVAQPRPSDGPQ